MHLDFRSPVPLSEQLAAILRGKYVEQAEPGSELPTLKEIAREFDVGVGVVREAFGRLRKQGLIYSRVGIGTFVAKKSAPAGELTIAFFDKPGEGNTIRAIIRAFEERNPEVTVHLRVSDPANFTAFFERMQRKNMEADLVFMQESSFFDIGTSRLRELPPEVLEFARRACDPHAMQLFARGRKIFGLPILFSPVVVFYNRKLFDARGEKYPRDDWDFEQFLQVADRLTDIGAGTFGFCLTQQPNRWMNVLLADNVRVVHRRGLPYFDLDDKRLAKSLARTRSLMLRSTVLHDEGALLQAFVQERISMIFASYIGLGQIMRMRAELGAGTRLRLGAALLPRGVKQTSLWMGTGVAMTRNAPHPQQAMNFLRFAMSPAAQKPVLRAGCGIPVLKQVQPGTRFCQSRVEVRDYDAFERYGDDTPILGAFRHDPEWERFKHEMYLVWIGMQDIDRALENVRQQSGRKGSRKSTRSMA